MNYFFYVLIGVGFFTVLYLNSAKNSDGLPNYPNLLNWMLMLFVIIAMAYSPFVIYSDKYNYEYIFDNFHLTGFNEGKDLGWNSYTSFIKTAFNDSDIYFLITAFVYTIGYYIFAKKHIPHGTIFIFLLACFSSFGFLSYGVNTIRAGFALSLVLIAFSFPKKKLMFILLCTVSILSHKSMMLPLAAFILTNYYNDPKIYFRFWLVALLISFANIGFIVSFVEGNLGSFDERSVSYFAKDTKAVYNTGFRLDFVEYSAIPIALGFYYIFKLKVKDVFYNRLFNTYLLVNGFWIIVIRMPFTDRFAYLSWFLIPFILLYPLLKYKLEINSRKFIFVILFGILAFTAFMEIK